MTRLLLGRARAFILLTLVLFAVLVFEPGRKELALHGYTLALAAVVLTALVGGAAAAVGPVERSTLEAALRVRPRADLVPEELERLERHVALARTSAYDLHYRLRPTLVEIAEARLWSQRGIDLARDPERAREALGDELYDLVRADRPAPAHSRDLGPSLEELEAAVAALERI